MESTYLSVAQINNYIKNIFEAEIMLQNICVYGEISSYNVSNGIAYFNIKDENNLLSCVLFGALRFEQPKIGDLVLVTGSVSYYAKGGRLSFNATKIAPYGRGMLYEKFLELKNNLELRGYFDVDKKLPIPKRVNRIGVVTSLTGAVIQDIIDVSQRRNDMVDIVIFPSKVQGVGAEEEIARGINYFSAAKNVDCIIVARGGGSLEDLQPFNTDVVAEAVFKCEIPLISAVGHETDFTIIDFVSDMRAPTPSAAAELVVNRKEDDYSNIKSYLFKIEKNLLNYEKQQNYTIQTYINKIDYSLKKMLHSNESVLREVLVRSNNSINAIINRFEYSIAIINEGLVKLNPNKLLNQGFTKIELDGKNIKSVSDLSINKEIVMRLKDGKITSKITELNKE